MEFVFSPSLILSRVISKTVYGSNSIASLFNMSFISFVDIIMKWIFEGKSECFISSLDFECDSSNDGFVWSPWVGNKSSSIEKSWSNDIGFEILLNSSFFHMPTNNFDWRLGFVFKLNLMKSIISPVITLINISWVEVIMNIMLISKVVCWINISGSH